MSRSLCVRRPKKAGPPCRLNLSVSPEIVAAREDFFNHGWTRIKTDEDRLSLIRVHPCSSVVGAYWLRLCRAAPYRRFVIGRALLAGTRWQVKNLRYSAARWSRNPIVIVLLLVLVLDRPISDDENEDDDEDDGIRV